MSEHRSARQVVFQLLRLQSRRDGDTHSVSAEGELDLSSSPALERELSVARESDAEQIVLDLTGLTFVDCAGLRVILCMDARSSDRPGRFKVRPAPEKVHRIFSLTSAARQLSFLR
ncbi:MAG: STAS domain-containing protein [Thermoleophilaceae bacterium]|nr:STAS domain-containing protein [Thermoleophilaceae bacterium]